MPVTIVVGGQFGSEGKGKVAHYFAKEMNASVAIRCGGPNSGHTVIDPDGKPIIFQQLPTASILPDISIVLCAGMYIDLDILFREIEIAKLTSARLFIDPNAMIITPEIKKAEMECGIIHSIGSTGSGTGEAVIHRIRRHKGSLFAKNEPKLSFFLADTKALLRQELDNGNRLILEGTQGYGLSLLHSQYYPNVTSRDTTAAGFLSEAGISPIDVDGVILTIRSFPIRVAGNSGYLPSETSWNSVTEYSNSPKAIIEMTSVTKKERRVAFFDPDVVIKSIQSNNPSLIVMNHLDYIDWKIKAKPYSKKILEFVEEVELGIGRKINYLGFGANRLEKNI